MADGEEKARKPRGFAAMSPEKQRAIASMGGKASHEQGSGHEWNKETARLAGMKGGRATRAKTKREGEQKA
jgi:general stress protein YciG